MKLTIIRGLPGSGKSTFAKEHFRCLHLEADMFCTVDGQYVFNADSHKLNHSICLSMAHQALELGADVAVSNTFTQVWEMEPYFDMAKEMGARIEVFRMTGDYGTVHGVPDDVIENMRSRFICIADEIRIEKEVNNGQ